MINPDDQAFPRSYAYQNPEAGASELRSVAGLTKREYFAAMAIQGILADPDFIVFLREKYPERRPADLAAITAVNLADALIAELNKGATP